MAIEKVINPVDDSEMILAKGVIKRISYREAKPNNFGTTHTANILIDEDWINFISMKVRPGHEPKLQKVTGTAPNLEWHDIEVGDEIKAVLKYSGEWQGKPQYTTGTSKINIVKKGEGSSKQQLQPKAKSSGNQSSSTSNAGTESKKTFTTRIFGAITEKSGNIVTVKDDKGVYKVTLSDEQSKEVFIDSRIAASIDKDGNIVNGFKVYGSDDKNGMHVGHAMNVAAGLLQGGFKGTLQEAAMIAHTVTKKLTEEFQQASGRDEGQSVGNAVKVASVTNKISSESELEKASREVYEVSKKVYEVVSGTPPVVEEVSEEPKQPKQSNTVSAPPVEDSGIDWSEDIPF